MPSDPYAVLQVARNAEPEVIAAAYRSLARKYHPDKNAASAAGTQRMQEINRAYEILKDPAKRKAYDRAHPFSADPIRRGNGDATDWSDALDGEDGAEWAGSYAMRRKNAVPIRRPGFWQRNLGCLLFILVGAFAVVQILIAFAGKM
jgi:DnaJ-class molecular chaperone